MTIVSLVVMTQKDCRGTEDFTLFFSFDEENVMIYFG